MNHPLGALEKHYIEVDAPRRESAARAVTLRLLDEDIAPSR